MISQKIIERDRYSARMIKITFGACPACFGTVPYFSIIG
jgi:hypothetical protein